jgi:hypothetical protein
MEPFTEPLRQFMGPMGMGGMGRFGTEAIYSFVIIVCSLMVYYATKEMYELSSYKGIKYFRQAFLFFALAYFFRSFIKFILVYFNINEILEFSPRILGPITLFLFMYFSSMAIFYLMYSILCKKWESSRNKIYIFHFLALAISIISVISRDPLIRICLSLILCLVVIMIVYLAYTESKEKKKKHNLYVVYLLLSLFWILNIVDIVTPKVLGTFQLIIYLASLGVFLLVLYKVLKKVGPN